MCESQIFFLGKIRTIHNKLELCALCALKGEHNVYSLVSNIAVCMYIYIYIDQK